MIGSVAARRGSSPCRVILALFWCLVAASWPVACRAAQVVTRLHIRPSASETVIAVFASDKQPLEVNSFSLDDPPRLVFDLPGARLDPDLPATVSVAAPALRQIRLGQFSIEPDVARIVVDLCDKLPAPISEIAHGKEPGETLIVLRIPGPALLGPPAIETVEDCVLVRLSGAGGLPRSVAALDGPPRVYADLKDAVVEEVHRQRVDKGVVREVRMAQQPAGPDHPIARVVVELSRQQAYTVFSDGADLVLAVGPHSWGLPLAEYRGQGRLKGKRIVVDPGHGGDDIGAPAVFGSPPKGPFEKDIVLDIGLRLARLLEAEGASVTMTRSEDKYLSLQERAEMANRVRAHALVSIHCDSCVPPNALDGTSVYYDHQHSARFARLVQEELIAALGTKDKGVRNANFAVIRRAQVPGILVETAYINHDGDRARLIHPNFRERAARAILRGMVRFLDEDSGRGGAG